jgi:hypothetical protein
MSHRPAGTTGRVLRALLSGAVAAVLVATAAVSAEADVTSPDTVGDGRAAASTPRAKSVRVQSLAGVTCEPVAGFSRTDAGALYRVKDTNPLGGVGTMSELGQVGTGWGGNAFAWTAAGGDGVLYALTWSGDLKWYRYNNTTSGWRTGSGRVIGRGFIPNTRIVNISLGGDGSFYVVRANGQLAIYRHTGRLTGAATWARSTGWTIGAGWTGDEIIAPNGDGTVYRQYRGTLYWYRHTDPAAGAVTWRARKVIGAGWNFYDILSAGSGVLYATQDGTGEVLLYRHGDPVRGANGWAATRGVSKAMVRDDSYGIAVDPMACSLIT